MIKRYFLLILYLLVSNLVFSQQNYYITDKSLTSGAEVINGGFLKNFKQCEIKTDSGIVKFKPGVVHEYGLDGRIYVSRKINTGDSIENVFLKREIEGKINLYSYQARGVRKFFLEKDSLHLIEIVKGKSGNSFREILKENTPGCEYAAEAIRLTGFTKSSLMAFCKFYNDCKDKPFTFNKFGIIIGFENTSIIKGRDISEPLLNHSAFYYDGDLLFGVFADLPILQSQFSFHPEVFFQKNKFCLHDAESSTAVKDIFVTSQSLNIPVLIKYTVPGKRIRPFFEAGPSMIYTINENRKVFALNDETNVVELDNLNTPIYHLIDPLQIGYSLGVGIQLKLNYRNSLFLGTRYNNYPVKSALGTNKIQILTGYNF